MLRQGFPEADEKTLSLIVTRYRNHTMAVPSFSCRHLHHNHQDVLRVALFIPLITTALSLITINLTSCSMKHNTVLSGARALVALWLLCLLLTMPFCHHAAHGVRTLYLWARPPMQAQRSVHQEPPSTYASGCRSCCVSD